MAASTRMKIGEKAQTPISILLENGEKFDPMEDAKYSITSVENSYTMLSPKRQMLYHFCGAAMIALPLIFSLSGILLCGLQFYRRKLKKPIDILLAATEKIAGQDLDFEVVRPCNDELGELCASFEQMRAALAENNKKMWGMLEERRQLQASVAHDLRNPIAIIEGHAQYLQLNLQKGSLTEKKAISIAENIEKSAKRLERYTESIREIHCLEELEIQRKTVRFPELAQDIEEDFFHIAEKHGLRLCTENTVMPETLNLDPQVLYRILENLIGNALRYAKSEIRLSFACENAILKVCVADDGPGFSERILRAKSSRFVTDCKEPEHAGIGLTVCRILTNKHGGTFSIGNQKEGGAKIIVSLSV